MFLVIFPVGDGDDLHLFFWSDPRPHGCPHPVVEGADLTEPPPRSDEWRFGDAEPHVLARSRRSPKKFKVFKSELDVPMHWDILQGNAEVWSGWEAFGRSAA